MTPERFNKIKSVLKKRQPDITVVMENVHKPHNLAAIIRTCDSVGICEAHAVTAREDFELSKKASCGGRKWVNLIRHNTVEDVYSSLRNKGMRILTAHASEDSVSYLDIDYTLPTAIIFGQELEGLTEEAIKRSDKSLFIPMHGMSSSLNVSVAAAIILYEAQRQRSEAGMYDSMKIDENRFRELAFSWGYPRVAQISRRGIPALDENGQIVTNR